MLIKEYSYNLFRIMQKEYSSNYDAVEINAIKIDENGFFPVCRGYKNGDIEKDDMDVLILGQDFGTVREYGLIKNGMMHDEETTTWKNLEKLLNEAEIDTDKCFYSNVFMGLRKAGKSTGEFPGKKQRKYLEDNRAFLIKQIDMFSPRLVIVLGKYPALELSNNINELYIWKQYRSFREKDKYKKAIIEASCGNKSTKYVSVTHPCMSYANSFGREFNQYVGRKAEIEIIKEAYK